MISTLKDLIDGIIHQVHQISSQENKEYLEYIKFIEMSAYENSLINHKVRYIAGIDEVGRGPLAGPVVAACVILPEDFYLPGINDSKKLSKKKREKFYSIILEHAVSYGIGVATVEEIDELNIYQATKLAMERAIKHLTIKPDHLLIDAMKLDVEIAQTSIIKGDAKSISIAAASIVAKVTRDLYMAQLGNKYPMYQFDTNSGYGTKVHLEAIETYGIIPEHRKTYEPIKTKIMTSKTIFDL
jgi:ribonuclease HII